MRVGRRRIKTRIRIIATSDVHGQFRGVDYAGGGRSVGAGLSHAAAQIHALRRDADVSITVDNGDFLSGPESRFECGSRTGGAANGLPDATITAMNAIGYDAAALGNHELDGGTAALRSAIDPAEFPVLCGNAHLDAAPFLPGTVIVERQVPGPGDRMYPLRVGILAVLPPSSLDMAPPDAPTFTLGATEDAARTMVAYLRSRGADVVVALCHAGVGVPGAGEGYDLAGVDGIDAIILGHLHRVFPHPEYAGRAGCDTVRGLVRGIPAVMPGFWARHVGRIDLTLERGTDHAEDGWHITGGVGRCEAVPEGRPEDTDVLRATAPHHAFRTARAEHPIGHTPIPIHSYFATVGICMAATLVADAMAGAVRAAGADSGLPVIGLAAPGRFGGFGGPDHFVDIGAGPVTTGDLDVLVPFQNEIVALPLNGADLLEWLERSVSGLNSPTPGGSMRRIWDTRFTGSTFDLPCGLDVEIDLTRPPRYGPDGRRLYDKPGRVRRIALDGREMTADTPITAAVTLYRASGGANFPGCPTSDAHPIGVSVREAVERHIGSGFDPVAQPAFRLIPIPQARAILYTGPGAFPHLHEIARFAPTPLGMAKPGFRLMSLDLAQCHPDAADDGRGGETTQTGA